MAIGPLGQRLLRDASRDAGKSVAHCQHQLYTERTIPWPDGSQSYRPYLRLYWQAQLVYATRRETASA